jgi:hypothetical protein
LHSLHSTIDSSLSTCARLEQLGHLASNIVLS